MDWKKVGRWVFLAGSLAIGIAAGLVASAIFNAKVPPAMMSGVMSAEARFYYIGAGVVLGFVIFGWAMLAAWLASRSARGRS